MGVELKIAVIGDFNPSYLVHTSTNKAIAHAGETSDSLFQYPGYRRQPWLKIRSRSR